MFALKMAAAACLCLSVAVRASELRQSEYNSTRIIKTCSEENGLTDVEAKQYLSLRAVESQNEKCFVGCLLREQGMVIDGKLFVERWKTELRNSIFNSNSNKKFYKTLLQTCPMRATSATDECSLGEIIKNCMVEAVDKASRLNDDGRVRRSTSDDRIKDLDFIPFLMAIFVRNHD